MDNSFELNSLSQWAACVRDRRVGAQLWSCLPSVHRDIAELAASAGRDAIVSSRAGLDGEAAELARIAVHRALSAVGLKTL